MKAYNSIIIETCVKMRVIYFYLNLFLKFAKRERRCLNESERAKKKKAEIKEEEGKKE